MIAFVREFLRNNLYTNIKVFRRLANLRQSIELEKDQENLRPGRVWIIDQRVERALDAVLQREMKRQTRKGRLSEHKESESEHHRELPGWQ